MCPRNNIRNRFIGINLFKSENAFRKPPSYLSSFMDINTPGKTPQTLYTRVDVDKQPTDQALKEEGKNEQMINEATKKEEDKQTVSDLIKKSNRRIISISSLFPWDFFPNTIEVEESRVTFIFRQLLSSQSHSVDIKDISNVFIQSSLFFAKLQNVSRTFVQNDITIGHLEKNKAQRVQMVIEGLRTFAEHSIDTSNYEINELTAKIEEFHKDKIS